MTKSFCALRADMISFLAQRVSDLNVQAHHGLFDEKDLSIQPVSRIPSAYVVLQSVKSFNRLYSGQVDVVMDLYLVSRGTNVESADTAGLLLLGEVLGALQHWDLEGYVCAPKVLEAKNITTVRGVHKDVSLWMVSLDIKAYLASAPAAPLTAFDVCLPQDVFLRPQTNRNSSESKDSSSFDPEHTG